MCDCFHLAFPKWHDTSSGTGAGRRPRGAEHITEDDSRCDEPSPITEGERPRPQGSSPVEEFPETEKYTDSDKEGEAEHDYKGGKKTKKSGFGSMFDKRSTPKMNKLKEVHSPGSEPGVIVKTAQDGCAEGLIYGGGGREGIFIKEVIPESPASKNLELKQGDQILSATVYFDNVSYEDAIQIMEHAQAYKMKLCLKREPDITQTEPAIKSDVIPEEDIFDPEMREQGKTKKRGDARISWPKFPSFGKGKKSGFTRSHSSSEADEQRKLELSPTTSETESPIKSEDALKGKKKHKKIKVSKKKGRVNSSEEQDTDVRTTGQNIGADIHQTQVASVMLSPDHFGTPSGKSPKVLKVKEDTNLRLDKNHQKEKKMELITIDSTLKTTDLTVVPADQESPSGIKSPDEKKKKKEKSELKMKLFGKDKQKKDAKAKSSPKRLKTIGASIEIPVQPESEKELQGSQVMLDTNTQIISSESSKVISTKSETTPMKINIPKVELDISDIALKQKSQQKGEEKAKTGSTFKLPKIGFSDVATEETTNKMNVETCTTINQLTTEDRDAKNNLHDKMSKNSLPKREDIEIPGMEDVPKRTKTKGIKAFKAGFMRPNEEIQAEAVQMSIDVNSVKEAVSKLPGYKLPKVDMSGVPIPEEITVIDANAQRISVKTPTKVVDTKAKPEAVTVKVPKIKPNNLTSDEVSSETKVDLTKTEMEYKAKKKQSKKDIKTGLNKLEDIPGKENIEEVAIHQAREIKKTKAGEGIKSEYELTAALSSKESEKKSKKTNIVVPSLEIAIPNIGIGKDKRQIEAPSDNTEYIDSVPFPEIRGKFKDVNADEHTIKLPKFGAVTPDISANIPDADMNLNIEGAEIKTLEVEGKGSKFKMPKFGIKVPKAKGPEFEESEAHVKTPEASDIDVILGSIDEPLQTEYGLDGQGSKFKMPKFGIKIPKVKGSEFDVSGSKKDIPVSLQEAKAEVKLPEASDTDVILGSVDEPLQAEGELDGQGSKFKIPKFGIKMPKFKGPEFESSLSKKDVDVKLPEGSDIDVTLEAVDVSIPEQKPLQIEAELDGQGGKFKMPKFGIKMPKIKGSEFDPNLPKKDIDISEVTRETDLTLGNIDVSIAEQKMEVGDELDGQGGKFKMPKFGIKMPKIKGPDSSLPKKDIDAPEVTAEVKFPEVHETDVTLGNIDVSITEQKMEIGDELDGQGGKFRMPKFGIKMPKIKGPDSSLSTKDIDVPEFSAEVKFPEAHETDATLGNIDVSITEQKMEAGDELDGQGGRFKMPKFGIKMPKIKGPDSSLSKKDIDVPEVKAEVKFPEAHETDVTVGSTDVSITEQRMEIGDELDGQGGRFKMPKFGIKMPKIKAPDSTSSRKDADVPEATVEVKFPEALETDVTQGNIDISIPEKGELYGQESKFKMPILGIKIPKVKGPEIDLSSSKKDVQLTLPEAKVELPEVEVKEHCMEIKSLEKDISTQSTFGSPSKFKMPTFKLPKFGVVSPTISAELTDIDNDVKIDEADVNIPGEGSVAATPITDIEGPSIDTTVNEQDGKGSKFKIPHLSFSMQKSKGPEIDSSLSKAAVELPEASKIAVDMKPTESEADIDGHGSKFKMPKFGFTMPKLMPDIDLNLSKKDIDVTTPEAKAQLLEVEVNEPSPKVEIKTPGIDVQTSNVEGSPSKFKLPTFKLHKFGVSTPQDIKVDEADLILPEVKAEVSQTEDKLPKSSWTSRFAFSKTSDVPKTDVTLPEAKTDVHVPDVDIKQSLVISTEGAPATDLDTSLKKSRFALPKFSFSKQGTKETEGDVSLPDAEICPEVELKTPEGDAKLDGQESKFKMPKFGISMPKVKGPEIDLSLSKKDVDVTLPENKAEVQIPDVEVKEPSAKVEIKASDVQTSNVEGLSSKFKMPKFGIATSQVSVKVPELEKDVKVEGADVTLPEGNAEVKIPDVEKSSWTSRFSFSKTSDVPKADMTLPEAKTDVHLPDINIKQSSGNSTEGAPATDLDTSLKKSRFALPKFSFSKQGTKESEIDVSLPDIDVSLPEIDAEVKQPEGEAKLDGQESKFKLPKFGISMSKVKGPELDSSLSKKDVNVTLPEAKGEVHPDVKLKEPSAKVAIKTPGIGTDIQISEEHLVDTECPSIGVKLEGKGSKFKLPNLGFSVPQLKGPEIDSSLLNKDEDVTLPDAKTEVQLPDVEVKEVSGKVKIKAPGIEVQKSNVEGSPSRFKMPKFGVATPQVSVRVPDLDKDIKVEEADLTLPEAETEVKNPDVEKPSWTSRFSFSKTSVKPIEADVNLDVPKVDAHLPDTDIKQSSGMSVEGAPATDLDGSLKKSRFALPKFSFSKQGSKEFEGDVSLPDAEICPEVEHKTPEGDAKLDGQESKFKMPKFGISMSKVKGPDIDSSLPEAKAEAELPDVEVKEPSARVKFKIPEIDIQKTNVEGSSSKFKMPKFGVSTPQVSVKVPDLETDIKVDGADSTLSESQAEVKIPDVEKPSWTSRFSFSKISAKPVEADLDVSKVDLTLTEVKTDVHLPDTDIKKSSGISIVKAPATDLHANLKKAEAKSEVKITAVEIKESTDSISESQAPMTEGDAKLIKPSWTSRFSFSKASVKPTEVDPDVSKVDLTLPEAKTDVHYPDTITLPEGKTEVLPNVEVKESSGKVKIKAPGIDVLTSNLEGSSLKFKMPKFGVATPQVSVKVSDLDKDIKVDGADLTLPEAKAEVKIPDVEKSSWTSRFAFSKTSVKPIEDDVNLDVPKVDETKTDTDPSIEGLPATDLDASLKKSKFSLFSFSKQNTKEPELDASLPDVEVSLPEGNLEGDAELDKQESKFKMPKFGFSMSSPKKDVDNTLPEAKVQLPDVKIESKGPDTEAQTESKPKMSIFSFGFGATTPKVSAEVPDDVTAPSLGTEVLSEGSGSKFKLPKFGISKKDEALPSPEAQLPDVEVKEPETVKQLNWFSRWSGGKAPDDDINLETPKVDVTSDVEIKGTSVEEPQKTKFSLFSSFSKSSVKEPEVTADLPEMEIKAPEPEGSKFKLPKFGMALTKVKGPEVALDAPQSEIKDEPKEESKSSKMTLTSFGQLFKKTEVEEENLATSKEAGLKSQEAKGTETDTKEDSTKDPERTGWFKW